MTILDRAIAEHNPSHVFGLFSGGHDSLCATHIVSKHPRFSGAVHVNTTCGIRQTREFVHETCREHGWALKEYTPPKSYRQIVLSHGFPGPGVHLPIYVQLKERCLDRLVREHKTGRKDRIMLVTGVRLQESTRRMGHAVEIERIGAKLWVAPILHWSADDKMDHMERHGLRPNPVVQALHMSGECLCGAFAKKREIEHIAFWYPEAAAMLRAIENEARERGVHHKWGTRPPQKVNPNQMKLCWTCQAKEAA